jgi:hypothetical protein
MSTTAKLTPAPMLVVLSAKYQIRHGKVMLLHLQTPTSARSLRFVVCDTYS